MAGSCVLVVMCNGVIISVCPSSTVLTGFLFYSALLTVAAPAWVTSRLQSLRRVPALGWVLHGPQSLRDVPPSKSMSPAPFVLSSLSLPMSLQASPRVFPHVSSPGSCHSFIIELIHSICFVFKEGIWQAGRWSMIQNPLGASANLPFEFSELWIVPLWI